MSKIDSKSVRSPTTTFVLCMAIIGNNPGKYSQISIAWFCGGIKNTILSISLLVTSIFWQRIMWEQELSPLDHLFKELNPILEETRQVSKRNPWPV